MTKKYLQLMKIDVFKIDLFYYVQQTIFSNISDNVLGLNLLGAVHNIEHTLLLLCKGKRQYLLTCKVSTYCLLALHGSIRGLKLC